MKRLAFVLALALLAPPLVAVAQEVPIERILKLFNDDFITSLDVRRAKLLTLVDVASASDDDIVMRLIARRLELVEVNHADLRPPATAAVAARRTEWEAGVGADNVPRLLARAGMTPQALDAWLTDDVRISNYVEQVFGASAVPTRAEMLDYYQQHRADYAKNGVVPAFDAVEQDVRRTMQASRRAALVHGWADSLVKRADVRDVR